MTEPKMNVHETINAVMRDVTFLEKGDKNTHQGFNFRGIDSLMNRVGPAMRKHNLIATPYLVDKPTFGTKKTKSGEAKTVDIVVDVIFEGPDLSQKVVRVPAESFDSGDKATAKAMSVALRTAYLQTLCLPTDEPDPDSFSYEIVNDGEKAAFIEKMSQVTDLDELRKMQARAKHAGAEKEWAAYGRTLAQQNVSSGLGATTA